MGTWGYKMGDWGLKIGQMDAGTGGGQTLVEVRCFIAYPYSKHGG